MSGFEIRPRFRKEVAVNAEAMMARFKARLEQPDSHITGVQWEHHTILKIPLEEQHFWSPQLSLEIYDDEEAGATFVRGQMGPKPSIWLMFVFFYSFLGFAAMIVMVMGFSQMNLGLRAGILWLLPVIGAIVLAMFLSARAGQKLARSEMERLYGVVVEVIGEDLVMDHS